MSDIIEKYSYERKNEQKKTEKTIEEEVEEKRTTLSLSLTVKDKKFLKMLAAEKGTTIAAIIHDWIEEHK
jgi:hypothetical protein